MIYTHPYERGFHLIATSEGYWHFSLLIWKWELSYNIHRIPPAIDNVVRHWVQKIEEAQGREASARRFAKGLMQENDELETIAAYQTRDDE